MCIYISSLTTYKFYLCRLKISAVYIIQGYTPIVFLFIGEKLFINFAMMFY